MVQTVDPYGIRMLLGLFIALKVSAQEGAVPEPYGKIGVLWAKGSLLDDERALERRSGLLVEL